MPFHKYLMIRDQHLEVKNTILLLERMSVYNTIIKWAVKIPLFAGKANTWSTQMSLFLCLKLSLCLSTFCNQDEKPDHKLFKIKENLTTHRKPEKWLPYSWMWHLPQAICILLNVVRLENTFSDNLHILGCFWAWDLEKRSVDLW